MHQQITAYSCMHSECEQWPSWDSVLSDIAVFTSEDMKFVLFWIHTCCSLEFSNGQKQGASRKFCEIFHRDTEHALSRLWWWSNELYAMFCVAQVLQRQNNVPERWRVIWKGLPWMSPQQIWYCKLRIHLLEQGHQSWVLTWHFEAFERGHSAKAYFLFLYFSRCSNCFFHSYISQIVRVNINHTLQ